MALPTGIDQVRVELGRFTRQDGSNGYAGRVTFTPSASRYYIPTGTPLPASPIEVSVSDGQGDVVLVASDARGCDVADVTYTVKFEVRGPDGGLLPLDTKTIYLLRSIPVVDLDQMGPVEGVTPVGVSVPTVTDVAGLHGSVDAHELATLLAPYLPSGGGGGGGGGGSAPAGGWAFGDMSTSVQALLGLAQDAVQLGGDLTGTKASPLIRGGVVGLAKMASDLGLPKSYLAAGVQASLDLADTALQPGDVLGGGDVGPADATTLGVIKLPGGVAGRIGGTANIPVVSGWDTKLDVTDPAVTNARTPLDHTHAGEDIASGTVSAARLGPNAASGKILQATSTTAAQWVTAPTGSGDSLVETLRVTGVGPHVFDDATWQGKVVEVDASAPAVVRLPTGQSPGGWAIITQVNSGQVEFQAGTGAGLDLPAGVTTPKTRGRNCEVRVRRRDDPAGVTFPTAGLLARFQGSSLGSNGSAISSWADSSGVGTQALVQATTGSQPLVATVSGNKVARFDGVDDFLNMTGTLLNLAKNRSVLCFYALAIYPTAVAGKRTLVSMSVNGATSGRVFLQKETDSSLVVGGRRLDADVSNAVARGGTIPIAAPFLVVGRMEWANNRATLYLNGDAATATTGYSNPNTSWLTGSTANTSNTASTTGTIGANTTGAAEWWQGDILDLGFFSSDVDRAALDSALMNQYPGLFTASDYAGAPDRWAFAGDLA